MTGAADSLIKTLKRRIHRLVGRLSSEPFDSASRHILANRDAILDGLPADGVGIELGVADGSFSRIILEKSRLTHLYSIDMWAGDRGHDLDQYKVAIKQLMPFRDRSTIIKARFDEVLDLFPEEYFDFVYVDGYAHTGEDNGQTFIDWYPKLKPGGLMAGDDYSSEWPLVIGAVDRFVAANKLLLNVTGSRMFREHQRGDYPSWFVIKPPSSV